MRYGLSVAALVGAALTTVSVARYLVPGEFPEMKSNSNAKGEF